MVIMLCVLRVHDFWVTVTRNRELKHGRTLDLEKNKENIEHGF